MNVRLWTALLGSCFVLFAYTPDTFADAVQCAASVSSIGTNTPVATGDINCKDRPVVAHVPSIPGCNKVMDFEVKNDEAYKKYCIYENEADDTILFSKQIIERESVDVKNLDKLLELFQKYVLQLKSKRLLKSKRMLDIVKELKSHSQSLKQLAKSKISGGGVLRWARVRHLVRNAYFELYSNSCTTKQYPLPKEQRQRIKELEIQTCRKVLQSKNLNVTKLDVEKLYAFVKASKLTGQQLFVCSAYLKMFLRNEVVNQTLQCGLTGGIWNKTASQVFSTCTQNVLDTKKRAELFKIMTGQVMAVDACRLCKGYAKTGVELFNRLQKKYKKVLTKAHQQTFSSLAWNNVLSKQYNLCRRWYSVPGRVDVLDKGVVQTLLQKGRLLNAKNNLARRSLMRRLRKLIKSKL